MKLKKNYEEKLKQSQFKNHELFKECRKITLEKKIF